jgi:hypothetical protein
MASFFDTLFGGGAEREAAERNRALLDQYRTQGYGFLDTGLNRSTGALNTGYDQATAAYAPLTDLARRYGAGSSLALDAYGANGAEGNARARSAFQAGPGYEWARDQGLDAVNRRRAIAGGWDSGNTDLDLLKFSSGLANQEYDKWRTGLTGFMNPELAATTGAASGIANAAVGRGTGLADLVSRDADARTNIAGSVTSGGMQANNAEAAGRSAGARNLLGTGLSLASLAAGGIGGGFGIPGVGNPTNTFGFNPLSRGIGSVR